MAATSDIDIMAPALAEGTAYFSLSSAFFPLWFGLGIAEAAIVYAWADGALTLPQAAIVHFAVLLACLAWLVRRHLAGRALRLGGFLVLSTLFLGPAGLAGVTLAAGIVWIFQIEPEEFGEWYRWLYPVREEQRSDKLVQELVTGREDPYGANSILQLADVIEFGTPDQKRVVLSFIADTYVPEYADVMRRALVDDDNAVRVQAATAVSVIEARYATACEASLAEIAARPEAAETWLTHARNLDTFAQFGSVDPAREDELRADAIDAYRRAVALAPENRDARFEFGRALVRNGQSDEAVPLLEPAPGEDVEARSFPWLAEALFLNGRYGDLHRLILQQDVDTQDEDFARACKLWYGRNRARGLRNA